jgi:hypothetical protein
MALKGRNSKALTAAALAGRNQKVWDLHCLDWTQAEIAQEVGLSQPRVGQIILEWASELEETPRAQIVASRRAQLDAKVSYWSDMMFDLSLPLSERVKASKEAARWFGERARINGEYAPTNVKLTAHQDGATYELELPDDVRRALT